MSYMAGSGGDVNLQATLASMSAYSVPMPGDRGVLPHHPITCSSPLRLEEDGALGCDHTAAPAGDIRTRSAIDSSISILLIELARKHY